MADVRFPLPSGDGDHQHLDSRSEGGDAARQAMATVALDNERRRRKDHQFLVGLNLIPTPPRPQPIRKGSRAVRAWRSNRFGGLLGSASPEFLRRSKCGCRGGGSCAVIRKFGHNPVLRINARDRKRRHTPLLRAVCLTRQPPGPAPLTGIDGNDSETLGGSPSAATHRSIESKSRQTSERCVRVPEAIRANANERV